MNDTLQDNRPTNEVSAELAVTHGWAPWIVCAANRLRFPDHDEIICAPRHFDPIMRAQMAASGNKAAWRTSEQGFVDQRGNFYTREEALKIALANGQRRKRCGGDATRLFSENLY
jgi:hypothetical protein